MTLRTSELLPHDPLTLVSLSATAVTDFQGNSLSEGVKHTGVGKICNFDENRRLSLKRYEIYRPMATIDHRSEVADRSVSVPMTSSNLERRDMRVKFFWRISITEFRGNSLGEGVKHTGVGKICNFRRKSPCISETVRPWLLWNESQVRGRLSRWIRVGSNDFE